MKRSDIWLIHLDPTIVAEINKTRPVIIVSNDEIGILPLKIVIPITEWKDNFVNAKWIVKIEKDYINRLDKTSSADTLQVRCVSQERFIKKIGEIDAYTMEKISKSLQIV